MKIKYIKYIQPHGVVARQIPRSHQLAPLLRVSYPTQMFVLNWFCDVLKYLVLYKKNAKILFLGLENAGKTSLLYVLKDNRFVIHPPSYPPKCEDIQVAGVNSKVFDLAGNPCARLSWKDFFPCVDGIVFLVDSAAQERFQEAKQELDALLTNDVLSNVPFLILGNKIDAPCAATEQELRGRLGLNSTTGKGKLDVPVQRNAGIRPCELFMCSVAKREGFCEGFRWLSQYID